MKKNATGNSRQTLRNSTQPTVQLELHGETWELDAVEQGAIEAFLTEMRKASYWKHEKWCAPEEHALAAAGAELEETPCVGRFIEVNADLGGWWHQDGVGGDPRFVVDAAGSLWCPSPTELQTVKDLLSMGESDHLLSLTVAALSDHTDGIPTGGQA